MANVEGYVAPGFEAVAEAFSANFTERGDVGAAFAAVRGGETVVDLWGGTADPATGRPWRRDTLQLIFSGTKGLVATAALLLVDRGELELDAPVARYWPEFAAHDKGDVTVAEVLSHQARLPAVRAELAEDDVLDPVRVAALLADQPRETDPLASFVYHPLTYGWLAAEIIRRVDGRGIGAFFLAEIAQPLGLELWIGLPAELADRVSSVVHAPDFDFAQPDDELYRSTWGNPPVWLDPLDFWNSRRTHLAEIPGAGAVGTARSVARLYGCLAAGGTLDGVRLLSPETLELGRREIVRKREPFAEMDKAYAAGYELQTERHTFGPPVDAYGHGGRGGSVHAAWPSQGVGVSYAMNQLRTSKQADARPKALLDALYEVV